LLRSSTQKAFIERRFAESPDAQMTTGPACSMMLVLQMLEQLQQLSRRRFQIYEPLSLTRRGRGNDSGPSRRE
jgi:hypothetical protein